MNKRLSLSLTIIGLIFGLWGVIVTIKSNNQSKISSLEIEKLIRDKHDKTQNCIQEKNLRIENENLGVIKELRNIIFEMNKLNSTTQNNSFYEVQKLVNSRLFMRSDKKSGLVGFVNAQDQFVIPPIYEFAKPFNSDGLAIVSANGTQGVIDTQGKYIIDLGNKEVSLIKNSEIMIFSEKHKNVKFTDTNGKTLNKFRTNDLSNWKEIKQLILNSNHEDSNIIISVAEMNKNENDRVLEIFKLKVTYKFLDKILSNHIFDAHYK